MKIKVGTFNLNNLFSRFNFEGAIQQIAAGGTVGGMTITYEFTDPSTYRVQTYTGRLIKPKTIEDTAAVAQRILTMDVDVLAVQEVEDLDILKQFNRENLHSLYPHQLLIEGNDPRFIDVALLSKLPLGAATSFQTAVHKAKPGERVFDRDLVEIQIFNEARTKVLFSIYNTHLKSHYGDDDNAGQGKQRNDLHRQQQAEKMSEIVSARNRTDARYIITGDMNDPPTSPFLQPMLMADGAQLTNALVNPQETRPAKAEEGIIPATTAWTHRFKKSGQPAQHELFDQIWLSPALAPHLNEAWIDRRTKHGGDGSDHDPAWIVLNL